MLNVMKCITIEWDYPKLIHICYGSGHSRKNAVNEREGNSTTQSEMHLQIFVRYLLHFDLCLSSGDVIIAEMWIFIIYCVYEVNVNSFFLTEDNLWLNKWFLFILMNNLSKLLCDHHVEPIIFRFKSSKLSKINVVSVNASFHSLNLFISCRRINLPIKLALFLLFVFRTNSKRIKKLVFWLRECTN